MLLFVGWAQFFLGEFESALAHFARGTAIARRAGSAVLALELAVGEALGLLARGRIAEALDVADGAVEDARPLGSAQSLVWTLYAQATVLEAGGDPAAAVRAGEEAVALTAGLEPSSITAALRLGAGRRARRHRRGRAARRASCSSCRAARTSRASSPASGRAATRCSSARRCSTGDAGAAAGTGRRAQRSHAGR